MAWEHTDSGLPMIQPSTIMDLCEVDQQCPRVEVMQPAHGITKSAICCEERLVHAPTRINTPLTILEPIVLLICTIRWSLASCNMAVAKSSIEEVRKYSVERHGGILEGPNLRTRQRAEARRGRRTSCLCCYDYHLSNR
jgi:hypothetical protein